MNKCVLCGAGYEQQESDASWEPEIFCSRECEILNSVDEASEGDKSDE